MSASVFVTYSSPQSFLSSQWPALRDGLQSQLPLRSVHWKPPSGPSVRTIQELLINFVAFDSTREAGTSQIPSNLLAKPLLNVYFVSCEDAESYKGPVRKQVKDWHALATQRKNQEWVIVHVVKADSKNAAAGFFQRGNVLDKLRADFNTDKRDRCVQLAWPVSQTNPVAWAEVLSKMKDGILSAFDSLVSQREDEVKRSEQQRLMPGWNFCTFFLLKESLAISYDSMNLLDDALRQYDQLEASFLHVVRERNLSWFGALIVPSPKDDSAPLLSVTRKSYQDLILGNTISVFDLRIYMLAREAALLARVGKLAKVCQKVHEFLVSFGRQLWEAENILPAYFIESWTYSSALSTIEQVKAWSKDVVLEGQALAVFNASKAELLELARHQLDILGVRVGHLPSRTPFTLAVSPERPAPNAIDKRASRIISHPQLMSCLHNKDAFYDLYIGLSNQAIDLYAKAGRRKFALKIHGSLAALDVHRGNLEPALQTYSSLPAHYSPYKWASLESYMLTQAINLHAEACSSKDAQWITLALSFLKNYVHNHGRDLLTSDRDALAYVSTIVDSLKSVVDGLESELVESEHPIFSFRIPNTTTRRVDDEDGCYLDIVAENRLPCEVPVDSINIILSGRGAQRLKFTSHVDSLAPGSTMVTLFCPTSSWGSYLHEATEARISHLSFRWEHRPMSRSKSRARKVAPTVVHLLHDLRALDVRVRRPRLIILGSPPSILLTVTSGRNDIVRMTIKLTSPSSVSFRCQEARFEDSDIDRPMENLDDAIILKDLDKDSVVPILVPYGETSQSPSIQVDLSVTYTTLSRPDIERSLSLTSRIPTVLPVRVNVEDFFRGSRLFSSFTISTTSTQYIRMASTDLKVTDGHNGGLSILKTNPQGQKVATVMPGRPVNALFSLEAKDDSEVDSLQLCIRYRMLRDEVEAVLEETIDSVITDEAVRHKLRTTFLAQLVEALESDPGWVEVYTTTGELHVPSIDGQNETQEMLMSICTALRNLKPIGVDYGTWRELRIPVDLPLRNVLAAARLSISSPSSTKEIELRPSIYAGQPVSALVSIHTTLNWGHSSQAPRKKYRLRFEINELVRDWLVSGRKRGDFEATDGGTYTTYVTLIPLHHGELPLPTVAVTPLPLEGEMTMGSLSLPSCDTHQIHGAEVVLVLPRGGRSTYVVDMGDGVS